MPHIVRTSKPIRYGRTITRLRSVTWYVGQNRLQWWLMKMPTVTGARNSVCHNVKRAHSYRMHRMLCSRRSRPPIHIYMGCSDVIKPSRKPRHHVGGRITVNKDPIETRKSEKYRANNMRRCVVRLVHNSTHNSSQAHVKLTTLHRCDVVYLQHGGDKWRHFTECFRLRNDQYCVGWGVKLTLSFIHLIVYMGNTCVNVCRCKLTYT